MILFFLMGSFRNEKEFHTYNKNFPHTVNWEEIAKKVEILSLPSGGPNEYFIMDCTRENFGN